MKSLLLLIVLYIGLSVSLHAQNLTARWVSTGNGISGQQGNDIAVDSEGNVYITGSFENTIDFGNGVTLTSAGDWDTFLAKYNNLGEIQWVRRIGGGSIEKKLELTLSKDGYIYIGGGFRNSFVFEGKRLSSVGMNDIFLAKLDVQGRLKWCRTFGSGANDSILDLLLSKDYKSVILSGAYGLDIDFGSGYSFHSHGDNDFFVAVFDTNGVTKWVESGHSQGQNWVMTSDEDTKGNIVAGGFFYNGLQVKNRHLNSNGQCDCFYLKYDAYGNLQWVKSVGGSFEDKVYSIATDLSNSCYIAGRFTYEATLHNGDILRTLSNNKDVHNGFILKLDENGDIQWKQTVLSTGYSMVDNVRYDGKGHIYATGFFQDTTYFDKGKYLIGNGSSDIFIAKYDLKGNLVFLMQIGNAGSEKASSIEHSGNALYLTGRFSGTTDFGNGMIRTSRNSYDAYTLKLDECAPASFQYPEQTSVENFSYVGDAVAGLDGISLTPSDEWQCGAIWYSQHLNVVNGFSTDFAFKFYNGRDEDWPEGSAPGADGIAFVLQSHAPGMMGTYGYGIGYRGIPRSLAVEIDTYKNDENALNDMSDPNGNHIGVFCNGNDGNSCDHATTANLSTNPDIIEIKPDGTTYYCRIICNPFLKTFKVWLDSTQNFRDPVIELNNFDLSKMFDLIEGTDAWFGITSSTGVSMEVHKLTEWEVCIWSAPSPTGVEEKDLTAETNVYPQPFAEMVNIDYELKRPCEVSVRILDFLGRIVEEWDAGYTEAGKQQLRWLASGLPSGIYFYHITGAGEIISGKLILRR